MHHFLEWHVSEFMAQDVKTVVPEVTLRELDELFERHDFNAFPVMEGKAMAGLVTKFDFLKSFVFTTSQLVPQYNALMKRTVGDVMTKDVVHIEPEAPLTQVLELMIKLKTRSLPVLDSNRRLVGIIARKDLMRALHRATDAGPDPLQALARNRAYGSAAPCPARPLRRASRAFQRLSDSDLKSLTSL